MGCEFYQRSIFLFYAPLPMFPVLYLKLCLNLEIIIVSQNAKIMSLVILSYFLLFIFDG